MARRKRIPTTRRLGEPILRFTHSEWTFLENAYGWHLSQKTRHDLKEALDAWGIFASTMQEFEFGKQEAARIRRISKSADRLSELLSSSSKLEDLLVREAMRKTDCDLDRFLAMLAELALMEEQVAGIGEEDCGPEDLQISLIANALRQNDCPVAVAKKIKDVNFTPSPFVRLVDALWQLRPETRLYTPAGDRDANLSQWISERLRSERP